MNSLDDFAYFEAVVRHQGFGAAGRALGVPKSRLSRRVRGLEDRLGVRLLERSTSRFSVTEIGQTFYRHCREALASIEAAEETAQFFLGEPRGRLRVSTPPGACEDAVAAVLPGFLADFPHARVDVSVGTRRVDLIAERIDVAIRVRTRLDTEGDFVVKRIAVLGSGLVASPAYLERAGTPRAPSDLVDHATLAFSQSSESVEWVLSDGTGNTETVRIDPVLSTSSLELRLCAACAGVGIALMPDEIAQARLRDGTLLRVLPEWQDEDGILHLIFPSRRGMLPIVRVFIDRVSTALAERFTTRR